MPGWTRAVWSCCLSCPALARCGRSPRPCTLHPSPFPTSPPRGAPRLDLAPSAAPSGIVRAASYATAARRVLLPAARILAAQHPEVSLHIHEHEPSEALALLARDDTDLALIYDYNLAPAGFDGGLVIRPLGSTRWSLGGPPEAGRGRGAATGVFAPVGDHDRIV